MRINKTELIDFGSMARAIEKMGKMLRVDGNDDAYIVNEDTFSQQTPEIKIIDGELYILMSMHYYDYEEDGKDALEVKWKLTDILMESLEWSDDNGAGLMEKIRAFPEFNIFSKDEKGEFSQKL